MGGHPWHYLISPVGNKGRFSVYSLDGGVLVSFVLVTGCSEPQCGIADAENKGHYFSLEDVRINEGL